ncbi:LCP family protein [Homoserinibacter sp. YIM 151385]|uniref:LCP family protein n=1 Tax=Homoserinibacter sp. YIM 151385 TaxID=2985506 RepID=UPI0022EFDB8F|nr:LCP family protein [Homoserinibacter sp. YIM 151385]WBU37110.1 LCP family protein [Homoserinibacter sp. YIM 151385]
MSELTRDRANRAPKPPSVARHGRLPRRGAGRTIAALVSSTLAVLLVGGGSVGAIWAWQFQTGIADEAVAINEDGEVAVPPTIGAYEGGFNMLVVGSDADSDRESVLNDVNILIHVSADQTNAVAVSLPRDLVVPFPSCKRSDGTESSPMAGRPINEALYYGGLACAVKVVEGVSGVDIQFAGMITFDGVVKMSNAIGGVDVCVAQDIDDSYTGLHLKAGVHTLKGRNAMLFLRTRHGVGDGSDLTRISSQQVFLSSLLRKVKSEDTLTDPGKLFKLAGAAQKNMTLSKELASLDTMVAMAQALNNIGLDRITFAQFPGTTGVGGIYEGKVAPIQAQADALFAAIRNDQPIAFETAGDDRGSTADPNATEEPEPDPEPSATPGTGETASPSPTKKPGKDPVTIPSLRGQTAAQQTCSVGR